MVSEVENLLKGTLVATEEFENSKKTIGIADSNITPDANGICPLGKQGVFTPAQTETLETFDAGTAPGLDGIPEAKVSDVITDNPIEVASPEALGSVDLPTIPDVEEPEIEMPSLDIQMPVLDGEVLAAEPNGVDDNLFVTDSPMPLENVDAPAEAPAEEKPAEEPALAAEEEKPAEETVPELPAEPEIEMPTLDMPEMGMPVEELPAIEEPAPTEEVVGETPAVEEKASNVNNEVILKKIDEFEKSINEQFAAFKKDIEGLLSNAKEEAKEAAAPAVEETFDAPAKEEKTEVLDMPVMEEMNSAPEMPIMEELPVIETPAEPTAVDNAMNQLSEIDIPDIESIPTL